jgi:hypothetical protein
MLVEKRAADRYRRLVAGRRLDALLPGETVGKALHRRRWRIPSGVFANCSAKQGRLSLLKTPKAKEIMEFPWHLEF